MSYFSVTANKIAKVWSHPNADRLSLAQVSGLAYQFVILKDEFKVGDDVLFFPPDSILPALIIEKLGLTGKLKGKAQNRIKTIKLRDEISQGVVAAPAVFFPDGSWRHMTPEQITEALGVAKYEPPIIACLNGTLLGMPDGVSKFDIENAEFYPDVFELLLNKPVAITEKLEGTNFWLSVDADGHVRIGQHKNEIQSIEGVEHDFFKVAREQGLVAFVLKVAATNQGQLIVLRGEYCGPNIQKNIYQLKTNKVFLFDINIGFRYLNPSDFLQVCTQNDVLTVPFLSMGDTLNNYLGGKTLQQMSNGKSVLADTRREGIVIKPLVEEFHPKLRRLMIKQRSPEYLAGTDL